MVDRPKKRRTRRGEPLPDGTVLVVRGDLLEPEMLRINARDNFDIYGNFGIAV